MTANASFFVTERKAILLVPSKAIQFTPDQAALATYNQSIPGGNPGAPQVADGVAKEKQTDSVKTVWVKNGLLIHPQLVKVGVTDEIHYELLSGLNEGDEVITSMSAGANSTKATNAATKSPFMPQRPGSNRKTTTATKTSQQQPPQP